MKKKIMTMVLLMILALALVSTGAFATVTSTSALSAQTSLEEKVISQSRGVLKFIEPEKEMYGLGEVDFSTLCLGEQIPAYEVTAEGLKRITDVLYFPIMSEDKWVATAFVTCSSDGNVNVQISDEYAEDYGDASILESQVALIFDNSGSYVFSKGKYIEAAKSSEVISDRVSISGYTGSFPATVSLDEKRTIPVGMEIYMPQASFNNQKYLSVPLIKQKTGSKQCWAACIASIRGYYGTSTTIDQVYNFANVTKYNGATVAKSKSILEKYGFTVKQYYSDTLNWYQLRTEIYSYENPIFAGCKYNETMGHALVIRGYYVYEKADGLGIISYMDPVTGKYAASSVSKDYNFYYTSSDNGKDYRITSFLSVSK